MNPSSSSTHPRHPLPLSRPVLAAIRDFAAGHREDSVGSSAVVTVAASSPPPPSTPPRRGAPRARARLAGAPLERHAVFDPNIAAAS